MAAVCGCLVVEGIEVFLRSVGEHGHEMLGTLHFTMTR